MLKIRIILVPKKKRNPKIKRLHFGYKDWCMESTEVGYMLRECNNMECEIVCFPEWIDFI